MDRGMKTTLFALFVGLLMVGCGGVVVDYSKLQIRNGVTYILDTDKPFTGYAKRAFENGQTRQELTYKDGKVDGLMTGWYENGQKAVEANIKDIKLMSAVVWTPNGEKCPDTNVRDGNGVLVVYKKDGTEKFRQTYKNGELVKD